MVCRMQDWTGDLGSVQEGFINWFFPRKKRKYKEVEFINLHQGGMSVLEYSLKFTKLSKYVHSLVYNPRDEMNHFVTEMSDDL